MDLNYRKFIRAIIRQILGSNLADSTIHGTGLRREILPTIGYPQFPSLLVQVMEVTEIVRTGKPRTIKFRLSDGEYEVEAVARRVPSHMNFDIFELGYKVSFPET